MWAEVNGERKKVACGPCIRGHRSSKCDHRDRVLVEVRKPGRPLSSCPHPSGSCSCERVVINYTIPKTSECACPSERAPPTATVAGNSRIQKGRRKSSAVNPFSLEKAIRAGLEAETDTSSLTHTPSETSGSNTASLPSSASSTPRLLPAQNDTVSSCCKPKPALSPVQEGGCCSKKAKPVPESEPAPKRSCCSGPNSSGSTPSSTQQHGYPQLGQQFHFALHPQAVLPQFQVFQPHTSSPASNPFGLGTPIYNHAAAAYHQANSMPLSPVANSAMSPNLAGAQIGHSAPEHNCRCGDSCSCFGCAAHPNNATMMEYVRVMAQFQYTGGFGGMVPPLYDMPTYPHQTGFGAEAGQNLNFHSLQQGTAISTPTQMSFPANLDMSNLPNASMTVPGNWRHPSSQMLSMPQTQFTGPPNPTFTAQTPAPAPVERQLSPKTEEVATTPLAADSPRSESRDEDTPTLSPSSYFWNQMTLPGCSDATGTCQCGDGCACVGCLTHGGHTGEQVEALTPAERNSFPDFPADLGLTLNDAPDFMNFEHAPS